MIKKILKALAAEDLGKKEIAIKLGKTKANRHLKKLISQLMKQKLIERTIPDKPSSRWQKYRLKAATKKQLADQSEESQNTLTSSTGAESNMTDNILEALATEELSKQAIANKLGKAKPNRHLTKLINQLLEQKLIERTIPEKPNSRLQKYRITKRGLKAAPKKK